MDVVENGCGFVEPTLLVRLIGGMVPPLLLLLLKADADNDDSATRCNKKLFGLAPIGRGKNTTATRKIRSFEMDENLLRP